MDYVNLNSLINCKLKNYPLILVPTTKGPPDKTILLEQVTRDLYHNIRSNYHFELNNIEKHKPKQKVNKNKAKY